MAFSLVLMCARVYFVERVGWTLVLSAHPKVSLTGEVYLGAGWSLPMSALGPLRAFICSSRLDSRLSIRPFCGGAHGLLRPWEVGLPAMSGVGPSSRLV